MLGPDGYVLAAKRLEALQELAKRSQPVRAYYEKLRAWDGGCALPDEPSEGEITDFLAACRAVEECL